MHDPTRPMPPVHIGERFTDTHTFTPDEVAAFSRAMGDLNPLHLDEALSNASRFKGLIASGTHTGALLMGLPATYFASRRVVAMGFDLNFRRPVPASATVTIEWTVTGLSPHRSGGQVVDLVGAIRDEAGHACVKATGQVLVGFVNP